jgi:hypothetical protein
MSACAYIKAYIVGIAQSFSENGQYMTSPSMTLPMDLLSEVIEVNKTKPRHLIGQTAITCMRSLKIGEGSLNALICSSCLQYGVRCNWIQMCSIYSYLLNRITLQTRKCDSICKYQTKRNNHFHSARNSSATVSMYRLTKYKCPKKVPGGQVK